MPERDPLAPMPPSSPEGRTTPPPSGGETTGDRARQQAQQAGGAAKEHASNVQHAATEHGRAVAGEAKKEVRHLVDEGRGQLKGQADHQTGRAAEALHDMSRQLRSMADGAEHQDGPIVTFVRDGGDRLERLAGRLDEGGFDAALADLKRFARQRPGMFLLSAFGAGMAAGRLLRNTDTSHLTQGGQEQQQPSSPMATGQYPPATARPDLVTAEDLQAAGGERWTR